MLLNQHQDDRYEDDKAKTTPKRKINTELLMMFDSNGRYIDKKKLWRADNAEYHKCSTLYDVSKVIEKIDQIDSLNLKYVFVNVGVNDCDDKNGEQVFEEMKSVISQIRFKIPNVKIIMSEITPRNDQRDLEGQLCNSLLHDYAIQNQDIIVTVHKNLRDPSWTMFRDTKHIREMKLPKFAANIIRALKEAYNITDKSALFTDMKNVGVSPFTGGNKIGFHVNNRLQNIANYSNVNRNVSEHRQNNYSGFNRFQQYGIWA